MPIVNSQHFGDTWAQQVATRRTPIKVVVGLGQSNWRGTDSDGQNPADNQVVQTYHDNISPGLTPTYYEQGVLITTYPASAGPASVLFEKMREETSTPIIVNSAIGGSDDSSLRITQIPEALATLKSLGLTAADVDLVWIIHGEAEMTDASQAAAYSSRGLERIVKIVESIFVNAIVAIDSLAAEENNYAMIRTAQSSICNARANRYLIDCNDFKSLGYLVTNFIHYTYDGQVAAVNRLWTAIT